MITQVLQRVSFNPTSIYLMLNKPGVCPSLLPISNISLHSSVFAPFASDHQLEISSVGAPFKAKVAFPIGLTFIATSASWLRN